MGDASTICGRSFFARPRIFQRISELADLDPVSLVTQASGENFGAGLQVVDAPALQHASALRKHLESVVG
jgi:hypothetical protein